MNKELNHGKIKRKKISISSLVTNPWANNQSITNHASNTKRATFEDQLTLNLTWLYFSRMIGTSFYVAGQALCADSSARAKHYHFQFSNRKEGIN